MRVIGKINGLIKRFGVGCRSGGGTAGRYGEAVAALPPFLERVLGMVGVPYRGPYNASKFALEGMTDTLRRELTDSPIHIILITPGPIRTPFRRNARGPFERWMKPQREGSSHPDHMWAEVERRLYKDKKKDVKFELPPSAVTAKLVRALETERPKPRYFVTTPTYGADVLRRVLSTRMLDRVIGGRQ